MNRLKGLTEKPEIRIVFDTSRIKTKWEDHLLTKEVTNIIRDSSRNENLKIKWYLPEIVVFERRFQMRNDILKETPLSKIERLEKLLNQKLNITEKVIDNRIKEIVEDEIKELGIFVISLDVQKVNWNQILSDAAFREPPFELSEKEKGFRDAVICESVCQLASSSQATTVLVTGDKLIKEAIEGRKEKITNLQIKDSIDEVNTLVNTLAAELNLEFILEIQTKATTLFFQDNNMGSLFYRENIRAQIEARFKKELEEFPKGTDYIARGTWEIQPSTFLRKDGEKVCWANRIQVEVMGYKKVTYYESPKLSDLLEQPKISIFDTSTGVYIQDQKDVFVAGGLKREEKPVWGFLRPLQREELIGIGWKNFNVFWSAVISNKDELNSLRTEGIEFIGTVWTTSS